MHDALQSLQNLVEEWLPLPTIPEVDWARMRSLDFQECFRARNELANMLSNSPCLLCNDFNEHVGWALNVTRRSSYISFSILLFMGRKSCGLTLLT
jgi:hypothetical protein